MPRRTTIATVALLTACAAGACAYAALSAQSQLFGDVLIAPTRPREIALTYDDGPNDLATERLLEVLARHSVQATFFMIGRFVRQRPAIARAVAAAGHVVGNHTMTHPWLAWQSEALIRQELADCNAAIEDSIGAPVSLLRPPHGARRPAVLRVARELGMTTVQWNLIVQDWQGDPADVLLERIQRGMGSNRRRGRATNLVLHDGGHRTLGEPRLATVEATARLLELTHETGTVFVTPMDWS